MLEVHLICVGKLKEKFYTDAVSEYTKRLSAYCRLTMTELPEERLPQNPSQAQIDAALAREAAAIRSSCLPAPACGSVRGRPASAPARSWPPCWRPGAELLQTPGFPHRRLPRSGQRAERQRLGPALHVSHDLSPSSGRG